MGWMVQRAASVLLFCPVSQLKKIGGCREYATAEADLSSAPAVFMPFFGPSEPSFLPVHLAVTAHEARHFLDALDRKRWRTQRTHGDAHQLHRIIVGRNAVGRKRAAAAATVNDRPFSALAHPDRCRFHNAAAGFIVRCCLKRSFPVYLYLRDGLRQCSA